MILIIKREELKKFLPVILFALIYTAVFILWKSTFLYTLPFLIGFIISLLIQPIIKFFQKKLRLNRSVSAFLASAIAFAIFILLAVFLCVLLIRESTAFISNLSEEHFTRMFKPFTEALNGATGFFGEIDEYFLERNLNTIIEIIQNSADLLLNFFTALFHAITSLPVIVTMGLVIIISAYFFARDMDRIISWIKRFFTEKAIKGLRLAETGSKNRMNSFMKSYIFLYFITFCEAYIIFSMLNITYPLTTALLTSIADILPILGPGAIFLPIVVYKLIIGEYVTALCLFAGWLIITVIRQIVEPKIVSSSVKLHPLGMLAAIYFSLVAGSFWLFIYFIGFMTAYSIIKDSDIFSEESDENTNIED